MTPRESVLWFANRMERKLVVNDHKGGWLDEDPMYLLRRCRQELDELSRVLRDADICWSTWGHFGEGKMLIVNEAADVANLAMMIADQARNKG